MELFLILVVPLFYLVVNQIYNYPSNKLVIPYISFLKGMIWFFPALVAVYFFQGFLTPSYKSFFLFLDVFFRDHFFYFLLCTAGYFVFFGLPHIYASKEKFPNLLAFFSGFFSLVSLQYFFAGFGEFNFYTLFILPVTRCFSLLLTVFLLDRLLEAFGRERIIYGVCIFLVIVLCALLTYLFMINMGLISFLLSLVLLAGSIAAFLFLPAIL
ncbi:MAG: hypothetical protein JW969_21230 [Spirochaetales bacterium]|nr:hypothetical protein [Spirochaetales bacterium]